MKARLDLRGLVPTAADIRIEQRPPTCPAKSAEIAAAAAAAMRSRLTREGR